MNSSLGKRRADTIYDAVVFSSPDDVRRGFRPSESSPNYSIPSGYRCSPPESNLDMEIISESPSHVVEMTWKQFQEIDRKALSGKCLIIRG